MTTTEFSNEFDLLWDNLRYNNSGYSSLNEYEKSVFLTQAQEELIKNYFNPKGNKYQEGFGDSDKRDMDFSNLIKTVVGIPFNIYDADYEGQIGGWTILSEGDTTTPKKILIQAPYEATTVVFSGFAKEDITVNFLFNQGDSGLLVNAINNTEDRYVVAEEVNPTNLEFESGSGYVLIIPLYLSTDPLIDTRFQKFFVGDDIFFIINENLKYTYDGNSINSTVKPLNSIEYDKLSSKVYFEPPKKVSWRLMNKADQSNTYVELLPHTGATELIYTTRYVKRPCPIILEAIGDYSINGISAISECELNPIIHREILSRAVILADNSLNGNLNTDIQLEQRTE